MRHIFSDVNVNWLAKSKFFVGFSVLLLVLGAVAMYLDGGPLLGIDFKGGTIVYVRFPQDPNLDQIRSGLAAQGLGDATIQSVHDINQPDAHEVMIAIDMKGKTQTRDEEKLDQGRNAILAALKSTFSTDKAFVIRNVEVVGPRVGSQLQKQAIYATLAALGGMLVYIGFRFEWIYGSAAVVAVFHDVLITLGLMNIFNYEISLTVIAALLTLVGYSMNDTIVIFDRVRENLRLMRRESLGTIVNTSINQTLSRTILTSGLTFITVLVLYVLGGQVLRAFSFALVVGIVVGTYSSFGIAAPLVVAWDQWRGLQKSGNQVKASVAEKSKGRNADESEGQLASAARR